MTGPRRAADLASAALRHVRDADHLLEPGPHRSVDQALHLAGFGPECVRKAALTSGWSDRILGHELGPEAAERFDLLIALDAHAGRAGVADFDRRFPALAGWRVERRYDPTGAADEAEARAVVEQARAAVGQTFVTLWLDGRLDDAPGGEW